MKNRIPRLLLLFCFIFLAQLAHAQSGSAGSSYLIYSLLAVAVLVFFFIVIQVSDNLLAIEAKQSGINQAGNNLSIIPGINDLVAPRLPAYTTGKDVKVLKRGHDILLEGEAVKQIDESVKARTFAVQPMNFVGLSPIPKLEVEVGQNVKAGDIVFWDKKNPAVKFATAVSGEVIAVNRAAKRAVSEVVILADNDQKYREYPAFDLENGSREELVSYLLDSGAWPLIRQRPFNVVADHNITPKNIFISTFDSAPLAAESSFIIAGKEQAFQKGLDVLNKLTNGTVHLGLDARGENAPAKAFVDAEGVEVHYFKGKHPSGNVGVQIHHIDPISSNDKVWTLGVQDVVTLGTLFAEGRFDGERIVALTGAQLKEPKYVRTYIGANIGELLKHNANEDNVRIVSGDVLSGKQKTTEQFLNIFDDQITVLEEGNYHEMFGWLIPIAPRPTISNTFPNFLYPDYRFEADTNTHGEQRAFVVTGQYEKVLPMDIYPQHLMKAILVNDFERMEGLGIYELEEEDIALCEFVCTSKQPLQKILRQGLDLVREQG
ncbi:MAG: Na(+)-translocating NADH-quinone reductase subunit A [Bacteroidota bacterium]